MRLPQESFHQTIYSDQIPERDKGDLLERIITNVTDGNVEEIKILQAISMFKMFPYKEEFKNAKSIILAATKASQY